MKKLLLLAAAAGSVLLLPSCGDETRTAIRHLADPETCNEAFQFLARSGPAALPLALEALGDGDPRVRVGGAIALLAVGKGSPEAIDRLKKALDDPAAEVREAAAAAIQIAPPDVAVPALAGALEDGDPRVRTSAALYLMWFGGAARAALDPLRKVLDGSGADAAMAARAVVAIPGIDAGEELDRGGSAARRNLAFALAGRIAHFDATVAGRASEILEDCARDGSSGERASACRCLGSIVRAAPRALTFLVGLAGDPDLDVQRMALRGIEMAGPAAAPAVPALVGMLGRPGADRASIAYCLCGIGPAAREAVPALEALVKDDDPAVQAAAEAALEKIRPEPSSRRRAP